MSFNRSSDGSQVPDPTKFPKGFKAVADFIHNLGMKSGLYTAKGPHTCQKRAASCLHEAQDAKNWAAWGIDCASWGLLLLGLGLLLLALVLLALALALPFAAADLVVVCASPDVKDDSCSICNMANGSRYSDMDDYHRMWQGIQDSGRPMILTVEGSPPADVITHGGWGNAKRVGHDISPSWGSMISLVDIGAGLWPYAHTAPADDTYGGWWNDLDMIEIGNGGHKEVAATSAIGTMYPWAVAAKTASACWTMSSGGSISQGGAPSLCLTAKPGVLALMPCSAAKASTQAFTLESNGNLHLTAKKTDCVALLTGNGPALVMAQCKSGKSGRNEEFTLVGGKLCSKTLDGGEAKCLKAEAKKPGGGGSGGGSGGFDCIADAASLARCRVHFTMWTIMKAPLLLGNDIRKMDAVALGVVKNKDALAISQDALGVQAQRVWAKAAARSDARFAGDSAVAVAAPCDRSRPTQTWTHTAAGVLTTTDAAGVAWCVQDVERTEEVGSWRGVPCASSTTPTVFKQQRTTAEGDGGATALLTPAGAHLTVENKLGASGPVAHTRYLRADREPSVASSWLRADSGNGKFTLMASERLTIRDDDKAGGVKFGGDFCLDLAQDADAEVWAGPLADKKWAVALLNRHPTDNATITVDFTMFNMTASSSFAVKDVWLGAEAGTKKGSITMSVAPQAVSYLLLTPV